ncbi:hypothetical protein KP509_11G010200 [Ceratopteris richardii]|uniref:Uncharacterized protein n=1 Tax=Ceratopteris richardii TaxID=49495 RepID=A0A8T2TM93_CERRI|nr:hypothetical protein KP509_11G010200 [Ceratopteris richardii]
MASRVSAWQCGIHGLEATHHPPIKEDRTGQTKTDFSFLYINIEIKKMGEFSSSIIPISGMYLEKRGPRCSFQLSIFSC